MPVKEKHGHCEYSDQCPWFWGPVELTQPRLAISKVEDTMFRHWECISKTRQHLRLARVEYAKERYLKIGSVPACL